LKTAGEALGVDPMTVKAWESGWKVPRPDKADQLAAYLGVSRAEVLGLLGILRPEEVETLTMTSPRSPTTPRARRRAPLRTGAQASATLPEDQGAYLSTAIFGPLLARVA
jgi:transcriptional regulator with XRE-family HTH domain